MGRASHSRRIIDAWDRRRRVDRRQVYGPAPPATIPRLEDFPAQSCRGHRFAGPEAPHHLLRDRDGAFGPAYTHRIRAMGIRDHPTAPRSPWQNGHVERLIGSIRRESLDHLIVLDEAQLRRVL